MRHSSWLRPHLQARSSLARSSAFSHPLPPPAFVRRWPGAALLGLLLKAQQLLLLVGMTWRQMKAQRAVWRQQQQ